MKLKKISSFIGLLLLLNFPEVLSQPGKADVYLLTCGPGTDTYSIYGHSALRVVSTEDQVDIVYNWGGFDFNTPNFAWKFAKGRLDYLLDDVTYKGFLKGYFFEERYVHSQKINLDEEETARLIYLINENLKPENRKYKYDFFYDDCSTRIRDLLEKAIGKKLLYPPVTDEYMPTFREMVTKYQSPYPWLQFGIDLIMGSPGEEFANFRHRMFLPLDMQEGLSQMVIRRNGSMIPLLQNTEVVLDFEPLVIKTNILTTPATLFTLLLIVVVILSLLKNKIVSNLMDIILFSMFAILAGLMIFFNFFTDHLQMKWNLNILWLNPVIILCLISLLFRSTGTIWFRIVFYISAVFPIIHFALPQHFNLAFFPLILILLVRSSIRSGFEWNPLSEE